MPDAPPLLILGRLRGLERGQGAVACAGGRIVAVGPAAACAAALPADTARVDAGDALLLPGFIDAHVHVLAAAVAEDGVDVSPRRVSSVADVVEAVAAAAAMTPAGAWVRATGLEETMLAEGRLPTRAELDRAAPGRAVRVIHRSGHAEVLSSAALAAVGIDESTPEAPGALLGRSLVDGRLDGLVVGMTERIERAAPPPDPAAVERAVRAWAAGRAEVGVTTLVDAGARNGAAEWGTFERLVADGAIAQTVVAMEGIDHLGELPVEGVGGWLLRGETKLQPAALEGERVDREALGRQVRRALEATRRVAVHAPTRDAVDAAVEAFAAAGAPAGQRLEHAPLLDRAQIGRIAEEGIAIVAQPGLLDEVTPRYERLLSKAERADLHPWRAVLDAGAVLGFSTDAPVSRADPLAAAAAASSTRPASLAPASAVTPEEAIAAWNEGAARASGLADRGRLEAGARADVVAIDGPADVDPGACEVVLTVVGGRAVFDDRVQGSD